LDVDLKLTSIRLFRFNRQTVPLFMRVWIKTVNGFPVYADFGVGSTLAAAGYTLSSTETVDSAAAPFLQGQFKTLALSTPVPLPKGKTTLIVVQVSTSNNFVFQFDAINRNFPSPGRNLQAETKAVGPANQYQVVKYDPGTRLIGYDGSTLLFDRESSFTSTLGFSCV
jgi:hypothetical protein